MSGGGVSIYGRDGVAESDWTGAAERKNGIQKCLQLGALASGHCEVLSAENSARIARLYVVAPASSDSEDFPDMERGRPAMINGLRRPGWGASIVAGQRLNITPVR